MNRSPQADKALQTNIMTHESQEFEVNGVFYTAKFEVFKNGKGRIILEIVDDVKMVADQFNTLTERLYNEEVTEVDPEHWN